MVRPHRNHDGADSARPKHGALVRREYGSLAPEKPAGNLFAAESQGSGDSPEDTSDTGRTDRRETGKGGRNGQCALLVCGQPEDEAKEQGPPEQQPTAGHGRRWKRRCETSQAS